MMQEFDLNPEILCQSFDVFVGSGLTYACQILVYTKSKDIVRIYLKFCKELLQVKSSTCNATVYGELDHFPLFIY